MEKEFVTYEIALALRELGFDKECIMWSNGTINTWAIEIGLVKNSETWLNNKDCTLPLWQQVIDWFREKYGIHFNFSIYIDMDRTYYYTCDIIREMSFNKKSNLTLNYSDYKDNRRRFAEKINEIEYPLTGNEFYGAREAAILRAIEIIKND